MMWRMRSLRGAPGFIATRASPPDFAGRQLRGEQLLAEGGRCDPRDLWREGTRVLAGKKERRKETRWPQCVRCSQQHLP